MAAPLHGGGDIIIGEGGGHGGIGGFIGRGRGCCGGFISASHTESALGEDDQGLGILERSISAALDHLSPIPAPPPTGGGKDDDFSHGSSNHDYF